MSTTPKTGITEMADNQASPYATFNEALRILEVHAAGGVISRTIAAEPTLVDGAAYILPASPTGTNWASFAEHDLVIAFGGVWNKFTPAEGWGFWINDADERVDFDGASWAAASGGVDTTAIHKSTASEISAITEKVTPANADLVLIEDSADSNNKKRVQVGNLPGGGGGISNVVEDTTPQLGGNLDTQSFTVDGRDVGTDGTKLDGIEAGADVTDTANVTAAGALMDSEVDADIKTLSLPASTSISAFGASLIDDAAASNARTTLELVIGTDVQAFDADTAKTDVDQSWTGSQRSALVVDNDGSFDMDAGNNFDWTPTAADVLEFTNETAGQSGVVLLNNPSAYTISLGAEIEAETGTAAALSAAGTYLVFYICHDGTNVGITYSAAIS